MPFVKLDTGILNSTLWFEKVCREVFITALLMAEPFVTEESIKQIQIRTLDYTGWSVPPGWYGFVYAAGTGILHRALIDDEESGLKALEQLGSPEESSRSQDFEGRRLVRVDGGYIVLNFAKYRDRDYTSADRSRRWRERQKRNTVSSLSHTVAQRDDTVTSRKQKQSTEAVPTHLNDVLVYAKEINVSKSEAEKFCDFYGSKGWKVGKNPMKDWKCALRNWQRNSHNYGTSETPIRRDPKNEKLEQEIRESRERLGLL